MATTAEMANGAMLLLRQLDTLWQVTDNAGRRDQISHQMDDLQDQIVELMIKGAQEADKGYQAAITALDQASKQVSKAIDDLNFLVKGIQLAAKAIGLLAIFLA